MCSLLPAHAAIDAACGEDQEAYFDCLFEPECGQAGSDAEAACQSLQDEAGASCLEAAPEVCVDLCQSFVDCSPDKKDVPEPCISTCLVDIGWSEVEGPDGCVEAWEAYGACVEAEGCEAFGKVTCQAEDDALADCSPFE